jgi:hypothetical protein
MKLLKILFFSSLVFLVFSSAAIASDFGWVRNFNIQAKADPLEFREKLATRFNLSELQVIALRNIFDSPADAYIMLRLGEMLGVLKTLSREEGVAAIKKYRSNKGKGWDELAVSLGVEPGSEEYLELKRNHDLHGAENHDQLAYSGYDRGNDSYIK